MYAIIFVLICTLAILIAALFAHLAWKKSQIEASVQVQSSSGDSEVMSFNYNFKEGESEDSKTSKIQEAFQRIQARRDENHAKFLEIKAKAIEENEKKLSDGEDLKLRSVTEGTNS